MSLKSVGDEFDIVILSTVRSLPKEEYDERIVDLRWKRENLGFLTNQHQICVAITRAKYGLIIVGMCLAITCIYNYSLTPNTHHAIHILYIMAHKKIYSNNKIYFYFPKFN